MASTRITTGWKKVSCRDYSGVLTECYFEGLIKFPPRAGKGETAVIKCGVGWGRERRSGWPFYDEKSYKACISEGENYGKICERKWRIVRGYGRNRGCCLEIKIFSRRREITFTFGVSVGRVCSNRGNKIGFMKDQN